MQTIKQLDDILANKIAAGEVIERPSNVVKELVENSIDAGATKIDVLIEEGGLNEIQVIDNGKGMSLEDAKMCFFRHATSKIKDDNDLFCIHTLGFRGEAIPSIAAISNFELKTNEGNGGCKVVYEYGKHKETVTSDCQKGSNIKITKLFQNVPARLKYIRSTNAEFASIQTYIEKLALSNPEIAFSLSHNIRQIFKTNGNNNLLEVVSNIYGLNVAKNMIPISFGDDEFQITGYLSKIDITRANKRHIVTMVNKRVVRNKITVDCINQAYRKYLADGRFPIAIVNIEIDPYLVDVNVHPSKLEVRFSKEMKLKELLTEGMEKALASINLTYQVNSETKKPSFEMQSVQETFDLSYEPVKTNTLDSTVMEKQPEATTIIKDQQVVYEKTKEPDFVEPREKLMKKKIFVKGQVHGTYIICEDETGMYLVDQHAAQERINYEYYLEKYQQLDLTMQDLLVPITLEYPMSDYLIIEERKEKLKQVGIILEPFGNNSYVIKQLPLWMKNINEHLFIEDMVGQLLQSETLDVVELQEHAIATLSCKASLKANTHLSLEGMQNIIDTLMRCDNPYVCPHGRPTIIYYSTYEIEKLFKRIV